MAVALYQETGRTPNVGVIDHAPRYRRTIAQEGGGKRG